MSVRNNNISEYLKPLINLGNEIDTKVKKIARNDYSETSIQESWKIARQLDEDSRHLKRECKQSLNGLKENVKISDKFEESRSQLLKQTWEYMAMLRGEMKDKYNYDSIPVPIRQIERKSLKENSPQKAVCSTQLQVKEEEEIYKKEETETAEQYDEIKEVVNNDEKEERNIQDGYSSSPEVPKFLQQYRKEMKTVSGDSPERPDEFYQKEKPSNVCRDRLKEKPRRVRSIQKTPQKDWNLMDKNYYGNNNNNYEDDDDDDDFYVHSNKVAMKGRSPMNANEVGDLEDMTITNFRTRKPALALKTPERPKFHSQLYKLKDESDEESQVTPTLDANLYSNFQHEENCLKTPKAENFYLKQFTTPKPHDIETPTPPGSEVYQQKDLTYNLTATSREGSFVPAQQKSTTIGSIRRSEFEGLKSYELGHLCLGEMNEAIEKINQLIINKTIYPSHLQSLDIRRACGLESKTSQFIINLLKLDRLSETEQFNVYQVKY